MTLTVGDVLISPHDPNMRVVVLGLDPTAAIDMFARWYYYEHKVDTDTWEVSDTEGWTSRSAFKDWKPIDQSMLEFNMKVGDVFEQHSKFDYHIKHYRIVTNISKDNVLVDCISVWHDTKLNHFVKGKDSGTFSKWELEFSNMYKPVDDPHVCKLVKMLLL